MQTGKVKGPLWCALTNKKIIKKYCVLDACTSMSVGISSSFSNNEEHNSLNDVWLKGSKHFTQRFICLYDLNLFEDRLFSLQ